MICIVENCNKNIHARGYCTKHYQRFKKHGDILTRVVFKGGSHTHPLHVTYYNMIKRCTNIKNDHYKYYGARGIKICDRWLGENGFKYFAEDMGERPHKYQIDRIDVNGDYTPENCRWVNIYTQAGNTTISNPVPGVGWHSQRKKWRARIKINGKEKSLGLYSNYEDAVKARNDFYNKFI